MSYIKKDLYALEISKFPPHILDFIKVSFIIYKSVNFRTFKFKLLKKFLPFSNSNLFTYFSKVNTKIFI